jgi:NADH:ubiquinone reductase (H+-translocating)
VCLIALGSGYAPSMLGRTRILIVGGGVVGLEVARALERSDTALDITVVDPDGIHVYQPLLPEVAAGVIEPRHAVVPLRAVLRRARVLNGEARSLSTADRTIVVRRRDGTDVTLGFDHLVIAPGSITRVFPIPGLVERAVGFQTVAEALHLRDRVIDRMQLAEASDDPARRTRALTFVFVGAGYSGVEAAGELRDMAVEACAQFRGVEPGELRFVLVEATDRILPMVGPSLREAAIADLEARHVEVRLNTLVESVDDQAVHLSDGSRVAADTVVWCAGARPHPVIEQLGLPRVEDGSVSVEPTLAVEGTFGIWSAGDCAAVPDLNAGGRAPGSAQWAVREARCIAANIERVVAGEQPEPFRYRQRGELITLGRFSAVGEVLGLPVRGLPAWLLRAAHHITRFPTAVRKVRVAVDWTVNLAFPREITSLGSARDPEQPLEEAAGAIDARVS